MNGASAGQSAGLQRSRERGIRTFCGRRRQMTPALAKLRPGPVALAAGRDVFVYEYRGYAAGGTIVPTAAAIQMDVDAIIDLLSRGGRRGVVIGLSMGGFLAIRSAQQSCGQGRPGDHQ